MSLPIWQAKVRPLNKRMSPLNKKRVTVFVDPI